MKKFCLILLAAALVITSCISYPINAEKKSRNIVVWDNYLPKEDSVLLFIPSNMETTDLLKSLPFTITSYNGAIVNWGARTAIYLPPGEIELIMDLGNKDENKMLFKKSFAPGEQYSLKYNRENGIPVIRLIDLKEKKPLRDQIVYYFPRPPKIILQGNIGRSNQTGEATVEFGGGIFVHYINENFVYDTFYPDVNHKWRVNKEVLPAGSNTLNFNIYFIDNRANDNIIINIQNVEITYIFDAGKEYTITFEPRSRNPFFTEYVVVFYESASENRNPGSNRQRVGSWKLVDLNKLLMKFTYITPEIGGVIFKD